MFPRNENRNEGTFAETTLLRNRPFVSHIYKKYAPKFATEWKFWCRKMRVWWQKSRRPYVEQFVKGLSTKKVAHELQKHGVKPPLLCHIWTDFMGDGGGLQYILFRFNSYTLSVKSATVGIYFKLHSAWSP